MTGICLLCGYVTSDLDLLDAHTALPHPGNQNARTIWDHYDFCPLCGAGTHQPCLTSGGNVSSEPHAQRWRMGNTA